MEASLMLLHQASVPKGTFFEKLDEMALQTFDDQCTLAIPCILLIKNLKEL
jgi:hypothetical protein